MYLPISNRLIFTITCCLILNACNPNNDLALLSSYPKNGICSIDNPERGAVVAKNKDLLIRGWAFDNLNKNVPAMLTLYFLNEKTNEIVLASIQRGEKRGDVAKALGIPALENSGFTGTLKKNELKAGKYKLILLQAGQKNGVISCAGDTHQISVE